MRLTIRYDMRAVPFGRPAADQYAAMFEQARWADRNDFDSIEFSEHHAAEDGYVPSPLVTAAAVAGTTRAARITIAALLLPLYDLVRLAEDVAVLDLVSGGRLDLVIAAGYRRAEFEMHGRSFEGRFGAMERGIGFLRQAWIGEPFEYEGRAVHVTPAPLTPGGPKLFLGGGSVGAARRAARIADGFFPVTDALEAAYLEACRELGKEPGPVSGTRPPAFVHVSNDPERAWALIAPHALHDTNTYNRWIRDAGFRGTYAEAADADALRAGGNYVVMTPDECVAFASARGSLDLHPLMGGLDPDLADESLALIESDVLPRLNG